MDYFPWAIFLSKVFFRHFVSAIWEQERTIVLSFHADCLRGGNCRSLLSNTVSLLSKSPFEADVLPFLTLGKYSCLNPFIFDLII